MVLYLILCLSLVKCQMQLLTNFACFERMMVRDFCIFIVLQRFTKFSHHFIAIFNVILKNKLDNLNKFLILKVNIFIVLEFKVFCWKKNYILLLVGNNFARFSWTFIKSTLTKFVQIIFQCNYCFSNSKNHSLFFPL